MKVSVVSPVYRSKALVPELVARIRAVMIPLGVDWELILVDDACPEGSWDVIVAEAKADHHVRGFKLSRNFGQHYAITAGLDRVSGDAVVVMDCDLQDRPEEIPRLLEEMRKGYDVVLARRVDRKDGFFKKLFSRLFYRTLGYLTGSEQDETVGNFGIYSAAVITEVRRLRESIRYFPTMVKWVGFRTTKLDVEHAGRTVGKSSYNLNRMLRLAMDIILAYSDKPLRMLVKFGVIVAVLSLVLVVYTLVQWALGDITVLGYASLITSIWFLSGCMMITLGVVGLYVGKTFEGVKDRPLYIIERTTE
ncbi:MAG: glycosyltransferase family 2 protein [Flavobacteriales bacterium]|nr:glycosyltransferase family 2 protein [Flavobacteriales bacterium]